MHLRGIAQNHAKVEEYIKGKNFSVGKTSRPARKNKSKKDEANQIRVGTEKATCKVEVASGPKTHAGRFRQYTPLVATMKHMLNHNKYSRTPY